MKNLPPLGKATAAFDEDVGGDVEVGHEEAGDDQYDEREAPSPVMCTMCQTYFHIHTKHQEEIKRF